MLNSGNAVWERECGRAPRSQPDPGRTHSGSRGGGRGWTFADLPLPPAATGHPQVWHRKHQVCVPTHGPCWGLMGRGLTGWGVSVREPHCASDDCPSGRGVVCTFQRAVSKGPSHSFLSQLKPLEPKEALSPTQEKRFMF